MGGTLPKDRVFSIEEAAQLVQGKFKFDDEEEEAQETKVAATQKEGELNLGRAMGHGNPNDPTHELNLEAFDKNLVIALQDQAQVEEFDERNFTDHVPEQLKHTFGLPKDMSSYEINFEAVRNDDANFKKRLPIWSG